MSSEEKSNLLSDEQHQESSLKRRVGLLAIRSSVFGALAPGALVGIVSGSVIKGLAAAAGTATIYGINEARGGNF